MISEQIARKDLECNECKGVIKAFSRYTFVLPKDKVGNYSYPLRLCRKCK